ncbi:alpha/beta hydrolase fold domain-containing protein [Corticicoccus populi]|uniref:Alpha/beta hydrolase fold domain-containing protein n=1 Tax=Corticicoccus populi TaxID=1812821 RepID=A0ABW5WXI4_9STAP
MKHMLKVAAWTVSGVISLWYIIQAVIVEKRSVGSKLAEDIIKVFNFDLAEVDEEMLEKNMEHNRKEYILRDGVMRSDVTAFQDSGMKVFRVSPAEKKSTRRVLYLHGGGYVHQPSYFHWLFIDKMVRDTGLEFIVPIYPKAPEYTYRDAYKKVAALYQDLLKESDEELIFMGDSAGGGLAVGFTQWLASENMAMPKAVIIISPWLDITLENPEMAEYAKVDPMLEPYNLKIIGRIWTGDSSPDNYKVSPIQGELKGLPKIYIFVGTREICLPDTRKFVSLLEEAEAPHEYHEYPMMNHVFPQYPILEGARARREIIEILEKVEEE